MTKITVRPFKGKNKGNEFDPLLKQAAMDGLEDLANDTLKKFKSKIIQEGGRVKVKATHIDTIEVQMYDISDELKTKIKRALKTLE